MKSARLSVLALACAVAAHADFSYTQTRKGGPAGADTATRHYFKGQKMKTEGPVASTIVDLDAQTITSLNHGAKTYTVTKFSDISRTMSAAKVDAKVDVRQTGQKKSINGYNANEVLMTVAMDSSPAARSGMTMTMEMSLWLSSDVPGAQELRGFYQRNMDRLPWAAMTAGSGNPGLQKAMADMQKQVAQLGGVPVMQVMRMKTGGDPAQQARTNESMEKMRAQMEAMKKQGGAQAQAAEQMMARMGGMGRGAGGSLFEITMESTGFSTAPVADSVFAIPAGYTRK